MRLNTTFLLASFLMSTVVACASSDSNGGTPEGNGQQPPGSNGNTDPNKPPAEKPLTARAVCDTVETDRHFGDGCSGTASGQDVCAYTDVSECGVNECVYDSRKDKTFSFTCAPKCNAADPSLRCPLGYECVSPDASCSGDAAEGVCTQRTDFDCQDVGDASGNFIEGPDGALLVLKWTGTQGTLRQKTQTGWRTLTTFTDPTSGGNLAGYARSATQLLIVTTSNDILVEGGTATVTKRATTSSYASTIGVASDGSFVSLESSSTNAYATLSKRDAGGKWSEVGPTRKRLSTVSALSKGFIARCGEDLCTSLDGESFDVLALPPDVTLTDTSRFLSAGSSPEDFYFTIDGRLFHQRKGKWVEEGPKSAAPTGSSTGYQDILRVSSTGAVAFFTYDTQASRYRTYVRTDADECWKTTNASNLNSATLVADNIMWTAYSSGDLCTLKIQ